ncbi:TetR family transcriptional regulator [Leifsonia sp. NPDC058230]|uniref:TetR family transcriptional regulator n=1 Tax=Leifsonia sp. NPDC058230 TaxID=3346391 RepID=UPI0036DAD814
MSLQTSDRIHRSSHAVDIGRVAEFRTETHVGTPGSAAPCFIVHALGREFVVSDEMAQIFLRQVERVIESDESSLVVLRHDQGLELLLVTDDNSFSIRQGPSTLGD